MEQSWGYQIKKAEEQDEHLKTSSGEMQANGPEPPAEISRSCSWLLQVKGYKPTLVSDQSLMLPRASFYCCLLLRRCWQGSED